MAPKKEKKLEKSPTGPGCYYDSIADYYKNEKSKHKSKKGSLSQSQRVTAIEEPSRRLKDIPGVGHYKEIEKGFKDQQIKENKMKYPKEIYKAPRFKGPGKETVPGPGAYEVLPKMRGVKKA